MVQDCSLTPHVDHQLVQHQPHRCPISFHLTYCGHGPLLRPTLHLLHLLAILFMPLWCYVNATA